MLDLVYQRADFLFMLIKISHIHQNTSLKRILDGIYNSAVFTAFESSYETCHCVCCIVSNPIALLDMGNYYYYYKLLL